MALMTVVHGALGVDQCKAGAFFDPDQKSDQTHDTAENEHHAPTGDQDANRGEEIDENGAAGAAVRDIDRVFFIVLRADEHEHGLYQRRPHKGLGETVDAPQNCHHGSGLTQGNE